MRKLGTILVAGAAVALIAGCEQQSQQLTPIDIEKMRPVVEIPESGKAWPETATSEVPQSEPVTAERPSDRPPAGLDAPMVDESVAPRPTAQPQPGALAPERPYLEGGDITPLGAGSPSGGYGPPGELTAPGSMSTGL